MIDLAILANVYWMRIHLIFKLKHDTVLPAYKGMTVRGLFGHSLRRANCPNYHTKDTNLSAETNTQTKNLTENWCGKDCTCAYGRIFERYISPNHPDARKYEMAPNPYLVLPAHDEEKTHFQKGEDISFDIVLIGEATEYTDAVAGAMIEMGYQGIGKGRTRMELKELKKTPILRWKGKETPEGYTGKIRIYYLTPTCIPRKKVKQTYPDLPVVARRAIERLELVAHFHCGAAWDKSIVDEVEQLATEGRTTKRGVKWYTQHRYSNRHDSRIKFGGWVGEVEYENVPPEIWSILELGSHFNIGKQVTTGMGRYVVEML